MTSVLPPQFSITETNTLLPIKSSSELVNFSNNLTGSEYNVGNNNKLKEAVKSMVNSNSGSSSVKEDIIKYHPGYYYSVLSSILTEDFHNQLVNSNSFFKSLKDAAMSVKYESYKKRNEIQTKIVDQIFKSDTLKCFPNCFEMKIMERYVND